MSESHDPPPGGDENRGYEILIVLIVTFIAALVPVCLRVWVRLRMAGSLGWDDYSIIGAMFIGVIGLIFNIPSVTNGFGRHTYYLTHQQIINARMWNELSQLQNIAGVWLVKISICVFLLRILGVAHRNFTNFLYALMAISTAVNLSLVFVWFFQCRPIQAIWNFTIEEKTCMPGSAIVGVAYLSAGFNMATDIICATFPIFFLRNIQINRGRKIALMVLTGFGLLWVSNPTSPFSHRYHHFFALFFFPSDHLPTLHFLPR
ncbi:hypothetical protein K432DRAFT_296116 [Lepidopterella palustris CBS 459.81]|uniref:Rhodopsin domain-containing protein n=1 Tax=Lepidopterella palustris CBS 459.81 TaxID=1314670 RepID=A0A8E2EBU0_9PEZI|nr:hypothetical protein K432DRAFT_296116 [Lepidopterella palustris CBS 459.81]